MLRALALITLVLSSTTLVAQSDPVSPGVHAAAVSLTGHPRVFFDGPGGPITTRLQDPDGTGPGKSAVLSTPYGIALEKFLAYSAPGRGLDIEGDVTALSALAWFMNNRGAFADGQTYLAYALSQLRNIDKTVPFLGACDKSIAYCGTSSSGVGSHADYLGYTITNWALTYTLLRDQLTASERTVIAAKLLNGVAPYIAETCTSRLSILPGTYRIASNGALTREGGGSVSVTLGSTIYVKRVASPTAAGSFLPVAKTSPLRIDPVVRTPTSLIDIPLIVQKIDTWTSENCGLGQMANSHSSLPKYASLHTSSKLVSAISTTSTSITVEDASLIPANATELYLGSYAAKESVTVTSRSGNTFRVRRGAFGTPIKDWPAKSALSFSLTGWDGLDTGWYNLVVTRLVGHIFLGLAFYDDHPGASRLLTDALAYWESNTMAVLSQYSTSITPTGTTYGLSRTIPFAWWIMHAVKASTRGAITYDASWLLNASTWIYWLFETPWDPGKLTDIGIPTGTCQDMNSGAGKNCLASAVHAIGYAPTSSHAARLRWYLDRWDHFSDSISVSRPGAQRTLWALLLHGASMSGSTSSTSAMPRSYLGYDTSDDSANPETNMLAYSARSSMDTNSSMTLFIAPDGGVKGTIDLSEKLNDDLRGQYYAGKNGWLLGNADDPNHSLRGALMNTVDVGDMSYLARAPRSNIEKRFSSSGTGWQYIDVDLLTTYHPKAAVTAARRGFVHFTDPDGLDRYFAYDYVNTTLGQRIVSHLHYPLNPADGTHRYTLDTNKGTVFFTHGKAGVNTQIRADQPLAISDIDVDDLESQLTIGPSCSAAFPCRAGITGSSTYNLTRPLTIGTTPSAAGLSLVRVWFDTANRRIIARSDGATVACTSGVVCQVSTAEVPSGVILASADWNDGRSYTDCPGSPANGSQYFHCLGNAKGRHVFAETARNATGAQFLTTHQLSNGASGAPADSISGCDSVGINVTGGVGMGQVAGGAKPRAVIFWSEGSVLSFTACSGFNGEFLVFGAANGRYAIDRLDTGSSTTVSVSGSRGAISWTGVGGQYRLRRL